MMTQVTGNVLKVLRKKLLRYHGLQMLVGEFYASLREGVPPPVSIDDAGRSSIGPNGSQGRPTRRKKSMSPSMQLAARRKRCSPVERPVSSAGICSSLLEERDRVRILVRHDPGEELMARQSRRSVPRQFGQPRRRGASRRGHFRGVPFGGHGRRLGRGVSVCHESRYAAHCGRRSLPSGAELIYMTP